jgi:hypothetical protein
MTTHPSGGKAAPGPRKEGDDLREKRYEICVGGRLGELIRTAFPDLRAWLRDGDTVLSGTFADQAALYGVLAQLEALGLELIEVRRVP